MSRESYHSSGAPSPVKPPIVDTSYQPKNQYGYDQVPAQYTDEQIEAMRRHDAKLKRQIRILRIVSRVLTALLSTAVTIIMATTLHKYLSTKDTFINGRTAWARNTKLWPTVMLFAIAAITLFLNLIIMIAYACSVKSANRASQISGIFGILVFIGHIFVWVSAAAIYRYSKDINGKSNDLWGWACSKSADDIQKTFEFVVNFDHICNSNANAWYTSIAEACLEILTLVIYLFTFRRLKHKKKMELAQSAIPVLNF